MKKCTHCKVVKEDTDFSKWHASMDGLVDWCKKCRSEYGKKYNKEHSEVRKAYREGHVEEISKYNKKYKATHREQCIVYSKKSGLKLKYGLSIGEYDAIFDLQNGCCAICNKPQSEFKKSFAVDHDHKCCPGDKSCGKCIRGLLCINCNNGIGLLLDSPEVLRKAAEYIGKYTLEKR